MKSVIIFIMILSIFTIIEGEDSLQYNKLTEEEKRVIIDKGTEPSFSGEYSDHYEEGTYICKRCNTPLYFSTDKFKSGCGWPSFDDEIPGSIERKTDADGRRTEILCANCGAHLGHVFTGEGYTDKNVRHCVNSISMEFIPDGEPLPLQKAFFAAGCFWGVEHHFKQADGVVKTEVGYAGGHTDNPSYEEVSTGNTGHKETIEVLYKPDEISYEELVKLFFEIHDFTQTDGQGPDIGEQYLSYIFYINDEQKEAAEDIIDRLEEMNYEIATDLEKAEDFWEAEDYHQDYYEKTGKQPYCHIRKKIFED
ncbi:MAG: bifunctional methionine sulfoxide reductase B/A protein [Candidatus Marinimicrobia bacterium]|nr:bifunctional methionine sulfoxide reductase B/A protein [Candidatus Neomarinimicrobiota bacterium]